LSLALDTRECRIGENPSWKLSLREIRHDTMVGVRVLRKYVVQTLDAPRIYNNYCICILSLVPLRIMACATLPICWRIVAHRMILVRDYIFVVFPVFARARWHILTCMSLVWLLSVFLFGSHSYINGYTMHQWRVSHSTGHTLGRN
jgi:hypothetical protein